MNLTINYCSLKHTYDLQLGQVRVVLLCSLCPWPYTTYIVKLLQSESRETNAVYVVIISDKMLYEQLYKQWTISRVKYNYLLYRLTVKQF